MCFFNTLSSRQSCVYAILPVVGRGDDRVWTRRRGTLTLRKAAFLNRNSAGSARAPLKLRWARGSFRIRRTRSRPHSVARKSQGIPAAQTPHHHGPGPRPTPRPAQHSRGIGRRRCGAGVGEGRTCARARMQIAPRGRAPGAVATPSHVSRHLRHLPVSSSTAPWPVSGLGHVSNIQHPENTGRGPHLA